MPGSCCVCGLLLKESYAFHSCLRGIVVVIIGQLINQLFPSPRVSGADVQAIPDGYTALQAFL